METGRGKKSKKAGWHLTLGVKETVFAGIGMMGLMMMSFALGALAGRGDIYRAASSLGLMSPEGPKVAQWTPVTGFTGGAPAAAPAPAAPAGPEAAPAPASPAAVASASPPVAASTAQAPVQAPVPVPVPVAAAKTEQPPPVTGSIAPLPSPVAPAAAKKKGKTGTIHRDPKAREEELRRVRQEVVQKLKFQNSFDTSSKARLPKTKEIEQIRVAQYRTSKEAQAKLAELQKKGIKATIKTTKDSKGALYIVSRPGSSAHADPEKLAKKPEKSSSPPKKTKAE